jgi:hypothetical protein
MLDEFIIAHRESIILNARARVSARMTPRANPTEVAAGVPLFLDELCDALQMAKSGNRTTHDQIGRTGTQRGGELLGMGLTIAQVVHDYGDVC